MHSKQDKERAIRDRMAFEIYCSMVSSITSHSDERYGSFFLPARRETTTSYYRRWEDMAEQAYELAEAFLNVKGAYEFGRETKTK